MFSKVKIKLIRATSVATLVFFLSSQVTYANPSVGIEMAAVRERPDFLQIDIPADLATLDGLYEAPPHADPKFILHVQNAHANYGAQEKIKKLLEYLNKTYAIKTLFVEGASEDLNPDYLKMFPDKERNLKLAQFLAEQGELTGAEMYLLEADNALLGTRPTGLEKTRIPNESLVPSPELRRGAVKAHGIEDAKLYRENYEALKKVFGSEVTVKKYLNGFEGRLSGLASKVFSPDLLKILSEWRKFEKGHREFMPYIRNLSSVAKRVLDIDLESLFAQVEWPQTTRLLVLQSMEKELDTAKGLAERDALIKFLKDKNVSQKLVTAIGNFKDQRLSVVRAGSDGQMGPIQPRDLMEQLVTEAGPKGFRFSDYPAFSLYAGYLILKSELDPKSLFEEVKKLFTRILDKLAATPQQKTLLELFRDEELVRKLLNLELTRKDWQETSARAEALSMDRMVQSLKTIGLAVSQEYNLPLSNFETKPVKPEFRKSVMEVQEAAQKFYEAARKRENVFYEKIDSVMRRDSLTKAVVITGGFHTDGITELLREHEISYGVLTPRLSEKSDENLYRSVMLQNKASTFELSYLEARSRLMPPDAIAAEVGEDELVQGLKPLLDAINFARGSADLAGAIQIFNDHRTGVIINPIPVGKKGDLPMYRVTRSEQRKEPVTTEVSPAVPRATEKAPAVRARSRRSEMRMSAQELFGVSGERFSELGNANELKSKILWNDAALRRLSSRDRARLEHVLTHGDDWLGTAINGLLAFSEQTSTVEKRVRLFFVAQLRNLDLWLYRSFNKTRIAGEYAYARTLMFKLADPIVMDDGRVLRVVKVKGGRIPTEGKIEAFTQAGDLQSNVTFTIENGKAEFVQAKPHPFRTMEADKAAHEFYADMTMAEAGYRVPLPLAYGISEKMFRYKDGSESHEEPVGYFVSLLPDENDERFYEIVVPKILQGFKRAGNGRLSDADIVQFRDWLHKTFESFGRTFRELNRQFIHTRPHTGNVNLEGDLLNIQDNDGVIPLAAITSENRLGYLMEEMFQLLQAVQEYGGTELVGGVKARVYGDQQERVVSFLKAMDIDLKSAMLRGYFEHVTDPSRLSVIQGAETVDAMQHETFSDDAMQHETFSEEVIQLFKDEFSEELVAPEVLPAVPSMTGTAAATPEAKRSEVRERTALDAVPEATEIIEGWRYRDRSGKEDSYKLQSGTMDAVVEALKEIGAPAVSTLENPWRLVNLALLYEFLRATSKPGESAGKFRDAVKGYVAGIKPEVVRLPELPRDMEIIEGLGFSKFFDFGENIIQAILAARESGLKHVEVSFDLLPFASHAMGARGLAGEYSFKFIQMVARLVRLTGIQLTIHGPLVGPAIGKRQYFEEAADNLELMKQQIRVAGQMGATGFVVHLTSLNRAEEYAQLVLYASQVAPNLKINLENVYDKTPGKKNFPTGFQYMKAFREVFDIVKAQDPQALKNLGIVLDVAHYNLSGEDPVVSANTIAQGLRVLAEENPEHRKTIMGYLQELHLNENLGPIEDYVGFSADLHSNVSTLGPIHIMGVLLVLAAQGFYPVAVLEQLADLSDEDKGFMRAALGRVQKIREQIEAIGGDVEKVMEPYRGMGKAILEEPDVAKYKKFFEGSAGEAYALMAGLVGKDEFLDHMRRRVYQKLLSLNNKATFDELERAGLTEYFRLRELAPGEAYPEPGDMTGSTFKFDESPVAYLVVKKENTIFVTNPGSFKVWNMLDTASEKIFGKGGSSGALILEFDILEIEELLPGLKDLLRKINERNEKEIAEAAQERLAAAKASSAQAPRIKPEAVITAKTPDGRSEVRGSIYEKFPGLWSREKQIERYWKDTRGGTLGESLLPAVAGLLIGNPSMTRRGFLKGAGIGALAGIFSAVPVSAASPAGEVGFRPLAPDEITREFSTFPSLAAQEQKVLDDAWHELLQMALDGRNPDLLKLLQDPSWKEHVFVTPNAPDRPEGGGGGLALPQIVGVDRGILEWVIQSRETAEREVAWDIFIRTLLHELVHVTHFQRNLQRSHEEEENRTRVETAEFFGDIYFVYTYASPGRVELYNPAWADYQLPARLDGSVAVFGIHGDMVNAYPSQQIPQSAIDKAQELQRQELTGPRPEARRSEMREEDSGQGVSSVKAKARRFLSEWSRNTSEGHSLTFPVFDLQHTYQPPEAFSRWNVVQHIGVRMWYLIREICGEVIPVDAFDTEVYSVKDAIELALNHSLNNAVDAVFERIDRATSEQEQARWIQEAEIKFFLKWDKKNGEMEIKLSDSGSGIPRKVLESLRDGKKVVSEKDGKSYLGRAGWGMTEMVSSLAPLNFKVSILSKRQDQEAFQFVQGLDGTSRTFSPSNRGEVGTDVVLTLRGLDWDQLAEKVEVWKQIGPEENPFQSQRSEVRESPVVPAVSQPALEADRRSEMRGMGRLLKWGKTLLLGIVLGTGFLAGSASWAAMPEGQRNAMAQEVMSVPVDAVLHRFADAHDPLSWLELTGGVKIKFVEKAAQDYLKPKVTGEGAEAVYHFELPKSLTLQETLELIKVIEALPNGVRESLFLPKFAQKFMEAAALMTQFAMAQGGKVSAEQQAMIDAFAGVGERLAGEMAAELRDRVRGALREGMEQKIFSWMGLSDQDLASLKKALGSGEGANEAIKKMNLLDKLIHLTAQSIIIELEGATLLKGMEDTQKFLEEHLEWKINVSDLEKSIKEAQQKYGADSPQAVEAQLAAIRTVLDPIRKLPGWGDGRGDQGTIVEAAPQKIKDSLGEANCLGRSFLLGLYLKSLGLKVWSVSDLSSSVKGSSEDDSGHTLLLVRVNNTFYWVEPSLTSKVSVELAHLGVDTIPSEGAILDTEGDPWLSRVNVRPFESGVLSSYGSNLAVVLDRVNPEDHRTIERLLRQVIALDPQRGSAYALLGYQFDKQERWDEAVWAFEQLIRLNDATSSDYYFLGKALHRKGELVRAIASYEKAIELDPKDAIAHYNLGELWAATGDAAKAIAVFEKFIELEGERPSHLLMVDRAKANVTGLKKALAETPAQAPAVINSGAETIPLYLGFVMHDDAQYLNPGVQDLIHKAAANAPRLADGKPNVVAVLETGWVDYLNQLLQDLRENKAIFLSGKIKGKTDYERVISLLDLYRQDPALQKKLNEGARKFYEGLKSKGLNVYGINDPARLLQSSHGKSLSFRKAELEALARAKIPKAVFEAPDLESAAYYWLSHYYYGQFFEALGQGNLDGVLRAYEEYMRLGDERSVIRDKSLAAQIRELISADGVGAIVLHLRGMDHFRDKDTLTGGKKPVDMYQPSGVLWEKYVASTAPAGMTLQNKFVASLVGGLGFYEAGLKDSTDTRAVDLTNAIEARLNGLSEGEARKAMEDAVRAIADRVQKDTSNASPRAKFQNAAPEFFTGARSEMRAGPVTPSTSQPALEVGRRAEARGMQPGKINMDGIGKVGLSITESRPAANRLKEGLEIIQRHPELLNEAVAKIAGPTAQVDFSRGIVLTDLSTGHKCQFRVRVKTLRQEKAVDFVVISDSPKDRERFKGSIVVREHNILDAVGQHPEVMRYVPRKITDVVSYELGISGNRPDKETYNVFVAEYIDGLTYSQVQQILEAVGGIRSSSGFYLSGGEGYTALTPEKQAQAKEKLIEYGLFTREALENMSPEKIRVEAEAKHEELDSKAVEAYFDFFKKMNGQIFIDDIRAENVMITKTKDGNWDFRLIDFERWKAEPSLLEDLLLAFEVFFEDEDEGKHYLPCGWYWSRIKDKSGFFKTFERVFARSELEKIVENIKALEVDPAKQSKYYRYKSLLKYIVPYLAENPVPASPDSRHGLESGVRVLDEAGVRSVVAKINGELVELERAELKMPKVDSKGAFLGITYPDSLGRVEVSGLIGLKIADGQFEITHRDSKSGDVRTDTMPLVLPFKIPSVMTLAQYAAYVQTQASKSFEVREGEISKNKPAAMSAQNLLPYDLKFLEAAKAMLKSKHISPEWGSVYFLKPGNELYEVFLNFLIAQLEQVSSQNVKGSVRLRRVDTVEVLARLKAFLEARRGSAAPWPVDTRTIDDIFTVGELGVFNNEIYPSHRMDGFGYSVDLGMNKSLILERRWIQQNPFKVFDEAFLTILLTTGTLEMDLGWWPTSGVHIGSRIFTANEIFERGNGGKLSSKPRSEMRTVLGDKALAEAFHFSGSTEALGLWVTQVSEMSGKSEDEIKKELSDLAARSGHPMRYGDFPEERWIYLLPLAKRAADSKGIPFFMERGMHPYAVLWPDLRRKLETFGIFRGQGQRFFDTKIVSNAGDVVKQYAPNKPFALIASSLLSFLSDQEKTSILTAEKKKTLIELWKNLSDQERTEINVYLSGWKIGSFEELIGRESLTVGQFVKYLADAGIAPEYIYPKFRFEQIVKVLMEAYDAGGGSFTYSSMKQKLVEANGQLPATMRFTEKDFQELDRIFEAVGPLSKDSENFFTSSTWLKFAEAFEARYPWGRLIRTASHAPQPLLVEALKDLPSVADIQNRPVLVYDDAVGTGATAMASMLVFKILAPLEKHQFGSFMFLRERNAEVIDFAGNQDVSPFEDRSELVDGNYAINSALDSEKLPQVSKTTYKDLMDLWSKSFPAASAVEDLHRTYQTMIQDFLRANKDALSEGLDALRFARRSRGVFDLETEVLKSYLRPEDDVVSKTILGGFFSSYTGELDMFNLGRHAMVLRDIQTMRQRLAQLEQKQPELFRELRDLERKIGAYDKSLTLGKVQQMYALEMQRQKNALVLLDQPEVHSAIEDYFAGRRDFEETRKTIMKTARWEQFRSEIRTVEPATATRSEMRTPESRPGLESGAEVGQSQAEVWGRVFEQELKTGLIKKGYEISPSATTLIKSGVLNKGAKILVIGSWMGYDDLYFAENGFDVTSSDVIEAPLKRLREMAQQQGLDRRIGVRLLDLKQPVWFPEQTYDVVFSHLSAHYVDDETLKQRLVELWRSLKPGGRIIMTGRSVSDKKFTEASQREGIFVVDKNGKKQRFFEQQEMTQFLGKMFSDISFREIPPYERYLNQGPMHTLEVTIVKHDTDPIALQTGYEAKWEVRNESFKSFEAQRRTAEEEIRQLLSSPSFEVQAVRDYDPDKLREDALRQMYSPEVFESWLDYLKLSGLGREDLRGIALAFWDPLFKPRITLIIDGQKKIYSGIGAQGGFDSDLRYIFINLGAESPKNLIVYHEFSEAMMRKYGGDLEREKVQAKEYAVDLLTLKMFTALGRSDLVEKYQREISQRFVQEYPNLSDQDKVAAERNAQTIFDRAQAHKAPGARSEARQDDGKIKAAQTVEAGLANVQEVLKGTTFSGLRKMAQDLGDRASRLSAEMQAAILTWGLVRQGDVKAAILILGEFAGLTFQNPEQAALDQFRKNNPNAVLPAGDVPGLVVDILESLPSDSKWQTIQTVLTHNKNQHYGLILLNTSDLKLMDRLQAMKPEIRGRLHIENVEAGSSVRVLDNKIRKMFGKVQKIRAFKNAGAVSFVITGTAEICNQLGEGLSAALIEREAGDQAILDVAGTVVSVVFSQQLLGGKLNEATRKAIQKSGQRYRFDPEGLKALLTKIVAEIRNFQSISSAA